MFNDGLELNWIGFWLKFAGCWVHEAVRHFGGGGQRCGATFGSSPTGDAAYQFNDSNQKEHNPQGTNQQLLISMIKVNDIDGRWNGSTN